MRINQYAASMQLRSDSLPIVISDPDGLLSRHGGNAIGFAEDNTPNAPICELDFSGAQQRVVFSGVGVAHQESEETAGKAVVHIYAEERVLHIAISLPKGTEYQLDDAQYKAGGVSANCPIEPDQPTMANATADHNEDAYENDGIYDMMGLSPYGDISDLLGYASGQHPYTRPRRGDTSRMAELVRRRRASQPGTPGFLVFDPQAFAHNR